MRQFWMALVLAVSTLVISYDAQAQRCRKCGVVENVDRFVQRDRSSGGGAVLGAVIGGVLGNQVGSGSGRRVATVAGAVAGGVIGNRTERNRRDERTVWEFVVRMDDGRTRRVSMYDNPDRVRRGDRVRLRNGVLEVL
jgi:outer membrane lipoprotein SlyB